MINKSCIYLFAYVEPLLNQQTTEWKKIFVSYTSDGKLTSGIHKELEKQDCSSMFTVTVFTITRKCKRCLSVDGWVRKMWYINIMKFYCKEK